MVGHALLQTKLARQIVRKGYDRAIAQAVAASEIPVDLWGQYAQVNASGGSFSPYGSIVTYPAEETFIFPEEDQASEPLMRHADFDGVDELRLLVTVTQAGPEGSTLYLEIHDDTEYAFNVSNIIVVPFEVASPIVPLDEVGLHVTDWQRIDWGAAYPQQFDPIGSNQADVSWVVSNPSASTGTVGVGLCQLLARGDLD